MDEQWISACREILEENFLEGIISDSTNKEILQKVKIRPVLLKDTIYYQITKYCGKQVFHQNLEKEEVLNSMKEWFHGEKVHLKQAELRGNTAKITIRVSKKGKVTWKRKKIKGEEIPFFLDLSHNRKKKYILEDGMVIPFLLDLGVITKEGKIVQSKYDKFKQINRFLEFIEDILPNLPKNREITILDFGCGKSYLTFAIYYYLHEMKKYSIQIIGLDLKKEVIRNCNELSQKYGYEKLIFLEGDIASYNEMEKVDMVVTLHACDTATDYALYKAIKWDASVILSVPCCQHELNKQIKNKELSSLFSYGVIKERTAALFTDALRANLLESMGYKTQILEFIDMEHTPKNLLIRAVKTKKQTNKQEKWQEYLNMEQYLGCSLTLGNLLKEEGMGNETSI
ncbi:MAG: SAM-dependent methyltransferase [Lachnospiraceae bacterium]|nr:SAM-dependent methyltransferase [Lachnospiraceae bacterium]